MYYPSFINFSLINTNYCSMMNLQFNQAFAHMTASANLYNVSLFNSFNFVPYTTPSIGMDYLLDPQYSVGQVNWINGGSIQSQSAVMPQALNYTLTTGGFGTVTNPVKNDKVNNDKDTGEKEEKAKLTEGEKELYNSKNKRLKDLITAYKGTLLSSEDEATLNVALRNVKGNEKEKYEAYIKILQNIGKDELMKFITQKDSPAKITSNKTFYKELLAAGYEYKGTTADKNTSLTADNIEGIMEKIENDEIDVLDFISSWYNNNSDIAKNKFITDYIKSLENSSNKAVIEDSIRILQNKLLEKAQELEEYLSPNDQNFLNIFIKDIKNNKDINNLYLMTRKAAINKIVKNTKDFYGEDVAAILLDDNKLIEKTKKDMEEECHREQDINWTFEARG